MTTPAPSPGTECPASPAVGEAALRHILVVDDSRMQRRIVAAMLSRLGYRVSEAGTGEEALALCRTDAPDLVLSDWMMPRMDGLDFCRRFRALDRASYGYFILLTSKSDKADVAAGLDAGADDFLTKPVDPAELRARIAAGARILRMERELSEKNRLISETLDELQALYGALDRDLMQAREIQQALIPETSLTFGRARVSFLLKPCGHVGGDLVGAFSPGHGALGVYGIDVSGHGITSALMTARVSGYLSREFMEQNVAMEQRFDRFFALRPPEQVADLLNRRLAAERGADQYFTMVYATADVRTGRVRMVQAGHPHPLLLRADGCAEFLGQGGLPVGLFSDARFDRIETRMFPGDRLLVYSDGFTECRMPDGSMLGEDGLVRLAAKVQPSASGREFLDDLYWHLGNEACPAAGADDDISAVLLEYGV